MNHYVVILSTICLLIVSGIYAEQLVITEVDSITSIEDQHPTTTQIINEYAAALPPELCEVYDNVAPWVYIDFDVAMDLIHNAHVINVTKIMVDYDGLQMYTFARDLYRKYNPSVLAPEPQLKIPKIIHQIWLGSPLPDSLKKYLATWVRKHRPRGWTYMLWTDEQVKKIHLYNQKYYDEAENYGQKSDILKWEVVYRFGGVYIDVDHECLRPLDIFHYTYDFYTGLQPLDTHFVQLGAALFGAVPGHPILEHAIRTIPDDWRKRGITVCTGPVHFTNSFMAQAGKDGRKDIAFPAYYFYPLASKDRVIHRAEWVRKGAFAVHHWAKTWMPPQYRRGEFHDIPYHESIEVWRD